KPPYIEELWLIIASESLRTLLDRVSLLRPGLREIIKVFTADDDLSRLTPVEIPEREELWKRRLARFPPVPAATLTPQVNAIIAEAPDAIDVVHARHGETLRYFGLPFARVRTLMNVERVWFGLDSTKRRVLDASSYEAWRNLLVELQVYRSSNASDFRHALYKNAAEAWLESLLRKD